MRTVLVLLIGVLAGAAAAHYLAPSGRMARIPAASGPVAEPAGRATQSLARSPRMRAPAIAARLEIHRAAADASAAELRRHIEAAAAEPVTGTRQYTLEALLTRLAEIDPAEAVRVAGELGLDPDLRAPLLALLAESDFEAALEALAVIDDAHEAEQAGLGMLEMTGYDERRLEQIVSALPLVEPGDFRVAALGALAAVDPEAALERTRAVPDVSLRSRALDEVARVWARADPRAALERAATIDGGTQRALFRNAVLGTWASHAPVAALRYAAAQSDMEVPFGTLFAPGMTGLAHVDPRELLEAAAALDGNAARMAEHVGVSGLAARDPDAALDYVEALPASQQRRQLMGLVATAYGRGDPDTALAWVRSLQPPEPELEANVLGGIAQADLQRALELALQSSSRERPGALQQVIMNARNATDAEFRRLADTLLAQPSTQATESAVQMVAQQWQQSDPEAALRWLIAHGDDVSAELFQSTAYSLSQQDPELAASYLDRVPDEVRPEWISAVASGFARADPRGAVGWIERFRGSPAYSAGAAAVAQSLARVDPRAAARLLDGLGAEPEILRGATFQVAHEWTQSDPYAAGQWAAGIAEPELRPLALSGVAQSWVRRDAQSAQGWVLSLPRDAARDRALGAMISTLARAEIPDARLLDAFSSDTAREPHLLGVVSAIAQRDEAAARAFVDERFTDPAMRRQAEQMLEARGRSRGLALGAWSGSGLSSPGESMPYVPAIAPTVVLDEDSGRP